MQKYSMINRIITAQEWTHGKTPKAFIVVSQERD